MTNTMTVVSSSCPACGSTRMRLLSAPRPQYVDQCKACRSTFFHFGSADVVSHNDQYNVDVSYQRYLEASNQSSCTQRFSEAIARLRSSLAEVERPSVFDVGAGGGDFLTMARASGFRIAGNEVSQPAIDACRDRHQIELAHGDDLRTLAAEAGPFDAVTMWCVIAHVDDPEGLLNGTRALLRPGGVLFFSTPRFCAIDWLALTLRIVTFDRYRRMFDRRINHLHRRQYSKRGVEALLRTQRFTPLSVEPAIGYGLHMEQYLRSIGVPASACDPLGRVLERLAEAGLLPRNVLNVYARAV